MKAISEGDFENEAFKIKEEKNENQTHKVQCK